MNNDVFFNNENEENEDKSVLDNNIVETLEIIDDSNNNDSVEFNEEKNSNNNDLMPVENNISDDSNNKSILYKCNDCNLIYSKTGENKECIYCGKNNLSVIDNNIDDIPYIIPFKIDKDKAIDTYKNYFKFNPLVPSIFKKKSTISSISKIYVAAELYDVNVAGNISFFGGDKNNGSNNNTDVKKYDVKNTVNFDFKNMIGCCNSKITNDKFSSINDYDFEQIQQFDSNIINDDTSIVYSDLSPMDVSNNVSNTVMDYSLSVIKKNINHQIKKLRENKLAVNFSNNKNILVPLYLLNINYNDNNYTYLMNGQTGKVNFSIVYGKKELIITSIILFILIFIISVLFVYFI